MASSATNHRPGRVARVARALVPSRRQLVVGVAIEVVTTLLGLPFAIHVALGAAAHLLVWLLDLDEA